MVKIKFLEKKNLILCLIAILLCFSNTANAFDDIPVYKIAQPDFVNDLDNTQEVEEKEILLEWNKWHAKVRNIIYTNRYSKGMLRPETSYAYNFYVDKNQKVSNVVVYHFPKDTITAKDGSERMWWIWYNQPFYAYSLKQDTYYKLKATKSVKVSKNNLTEIVKNSEVVSIVKQHQVPWVGSDMKKFANNITRLETVFGKSLVFPAGSKREKILVVALYRHTYGQGSDYTENDFDDVEKIKK